MKNYTLNELDAKTFILNYSIEGDKMIIHLASGENYPVSYTSENKTKVLEIMKGQVLGADDFKNAQEKKYSSNCRWLKIDILFLLLNVVMLATGFGFKPVISGLLCFVYTFCIAGRISHMRYSKQMIEDIDKNLLFLEYEELLNEKTLSCEYEKVKELNSSISEVKQQLTINDVNRYESEELRTILDNIRFQKKQQESQGSFILTTFWTLVNCFVKEYFHVKECIDNINNKNFLENEDVPSCMDEKENQLKDSISGDKQLLTLNDMDRVGFKELKRIIEKKETLMELKKQFGPYCAPVQEDKSRTLTRKKN